MLREDWVLLWHHYVKRGMVPYHYVDFDIVVDPAQYPKDTNHPIAIGIGFCGVRLLFLFLYLPHDRHLGGSYETSTVHLAELHHAAKSKHALH